MSETLRRHVKARHPRIPRSLRERRPAEQLARAHGREHHRLSPDHRHEGPNLGPDERPEGWRTGEDVVDGRFRIGDRVRLREDAEWEGAFLYAGKDYTVTDVGGLFHEDVSIWNPRTGGLLVRSGWLFKVEEGTG